MLLIVPMWMNFLLRTYAWQSILEKTGILNAFLNAIGLPSQHLINTPGGIILGMVYDFLPFMILPIYNTIVKLDVSLTEAARDLGANGRGAFLRVTLPLSVPGIISGVSMVFLPAMTNYVVLDMLYNSTYIMGSLIGSYFAAYNWHGGSMIALVLLAFICLFTLLTENDDEGDARTGGALL
jgi:spermidine/putrescine transport system permease protein